MMSIEGLAKTAPIGDICPLLPKGESIPFSMHFIEGTHYHLVQRTYSTQPLPCASSVWAYVSQQDRIQFPYVRSLIEKIEALHIPFCTLPPHDSSEPSFCDVGADKAKELFSFLRELQTDPHPLQLSKGTLEKVLKDLHTHHYLRQEEYEDYAKTIHTSIDLSDIEQYAQEQKDIPAALSLACYFRSLHTHSTHKAIHWLCEAKRYIGAEPLSNYIHLDRFLSSLQQIDSLEIVDPVMAEIAQAISQCSTLKEFSFSSHEPYDQETVEKLKVFLTNSPFIERLSLGPAKPSPIPPFCAATCAPLMQALEIHPSIQVLDMSNTAIGDEGVHMLVDACLKNRNSPLRRLDLTSCDLGDEGARAILRLVQSRNCVSSIKLSENPRISEALQREIERTIKEKGTTQPVRCLQNA